MVANDQMMQLDVAKIPLTGIHLIEASAGTGKTYNITRIYLRLLLEKQLTVQQILVMTFTKDATEEIKNRIDTVLRTSLLNWQSLVETDEFYQALAGHVNANVAQVLLKKALLFLDEAAIYTIHSFCQTVLSQHAFSTGVSFNANLDGDQHELTLQATQDWYRKLAAEKKESYALLTEFYPLPSSFVASFGQALNSNQEVLLYDEQAFVDEFTSELNSALTTLMANKAYLFEQLVDNKKPDEQASRTQEFDQLIDWLNTCIGDYTQCQLTMPAKFFDGKRFSRSEAKEKLKAIFQSLNWIKKRKESLFKDIQKCRALAIAKAGFSEIYLLVEKEKNKSNVLSFDDLISRLAHVLTNDNSKTLAATISAQYPFALVDEFQDTDANQYNILEALYGDSCSHHGLMMIGDPKQAIYGFRGGDIFTYLKARNDADYCWNMDTNWRSSLSMINGYNRLFFGAPSSSKSGEVFGYNIQYHPVKPSPKAKDECENTKSALHFVYFDHQGNRAKPQTFRQNMANWCATEIARLLSQKSIQAKDIALLVRDGIEANEIKEALHTLGLSAVYLSDRTNLWLSKQAQQLMVVLTGILHVENDRLFCAAIANPLLGYTPAQYEALLNNDQQWQDLKLQFEALKKSWLEQGFIAMALNLMHNLLSVNNDEKERTLTNLLHLFEVIQHASQQHREPEELLHWCHQQIATNSNAQETELRLESEDELIRIVTQHGSKGLEYPVVFVPFATRHKNPLMFGNKKRELLKYHNHEGEQVISLLGDSDAYKAMADEAYAETVRLLYVAVTRAEQQCYLLATAFDNYHLSPLGQTLKWQNKQDIRKSFEDLATELPQYISVVDAEEQAIGVTIEQPVKHEQVLVSQFQATIERDWWLSSFTALSRNVRHAGVSSPEHHDDESNKTTPLHMDDEEMQLCFDMEKGANTGNLLHHILEIADFSEPNWSETCYWPLKKYGQLPEPYSENDLYAWLDNILHTPFNKEDSLSLALLNTGNTLKEVEFYFPLQQTKTKALTQFINQHRKTLRSYLGYNGISDNLYLPAFNTLKGMMHGFIDLVFEYEGKYYICDFKSTHLGSHVSRYHQELLLDDMQAHQYDLQYAIYALALHRFLKLRVEGYDFDTHFGGVYYLYLRGMTGRLQDGNNGIFYCPASALDLKKLDSIFSDDGLPSTELAGVADE